MKLIDLIERKFPRFGISNLISHIVIISAAVYIAGMTGYPLDPLLAMNAQAVMAGEVWRLITFIFIIPSSNIVFTALAYMFVYYTGKQLESVWGTCRFTLYYILAMLSTIAASFIAPGLYTGYYIQLSLFIAFAIYYPDYQILYMMIIPIKIKYIMYLDIALLAVTVLQGIAMRNWGLVLAVIASLVAPIVFFGRDGIGRIKAYFRRMSYKRKIK
ncbi:MAG: hypothetical protein FWG30_00280 [Eubacteriaceae bacterium]|nr:hypothetical protein [Eubacteriaceae bacterium]